MNSIYKTEQKVLDELNGVKKHVNKYTLIAALIGTVQIILMLIVLALLKLLGEGALITISFIVLNIHMWYAYFAKTRGHLIYLSIVYTYMISMVALNSLSNIIFIPNIVIVILNVFGYLEILKSSSKSYAKKQKEKVYVSIIGVIYIVLIILMARNLYYNAADSTGGIIYLIMLFMAVFLSAILIIIIKFVCSDKNKSQL